MPKNISVASLAKIAEKTGTQPVMILEVLWNDTTSIKYSDKELPGIEGLILELSNYSTTTKLGDVGNTGSMSVVLNDTSGVIKGLMDQYDINKRPCRVFQYFDGMLLSEAFVIFNGIIASPIVWDEGDRTVAFEIISSYTHGEVGFAPEEGQFEGVNAELIDKVWPLCFGAPIHVPATKSSEIVSGTLIQPYTIPDATLKYKKELIQHRIDSIQFQYNLNLQIIETMNANIRPAYIVQEDYANKIVAYDHTRQTIEDLIDAIEGVNRLIDEQIHKFHDAANQDAANTIKQNIQNLRANRDVQVDGLKSLYLMLHDLEKDFEATNVEASNCKYKLTTTQKLREKCRQLVKQYYDLLGLQTEIENRLNEQTQFNFSPIPVLYGNDFPQNSSQTITINDMSFAGGFNGNLLIITTPIAKYNNVPISTQTDDDEQTLHVTDSSYKLAGNYALIKVRDFTHPFIVRVTSQTGTKVTFELPKKNKNLRTKQKNFNFALNPRDADAFNEGLERLATGIETPEQLEAIANELPRDLSPKINKILYGDGNIQYIEGFSTISGNDFNDGTIDYVKSYYTLVYGDSEETEHIKFDDSAVQIKSKILASTISVDDSNLQVDLQSTSSKYKVKLTINNLMKPFRLNQVLLYSVGGQAKKNCVVVIKNQDKTPTKVKLKFNRDIYEQIDTLTLSGYMGIIYNGITTWVDIDAAASTIEAAMIANEAMVAGELEISGGKLELNDIIFEYNVPFRGILFDFSKATVDPVNPVYAKKYKVEDREFFTFEVVGGSAFEYTRKQRDKHLEDEIMRSINAPAIKKYKDTIRDLIKLKKTAEDFGQAKEIEDDIQAALGSFTEINKQILQSEYVTQEAYKVISDQEHEALYELEMTGYLEWVSNYRELDLHLEESDFIFTADKITEITAVSKEIIKDWLNYLDGIQDRYERLAHIEVLPDKTVGFYAFVGDHVDLQAAYQEKYVANIMPSIVKSVYAYREISGVRRLVPVPRRYYSINTSDFYGSLECTTVSMVQPLNVLGKGWETQIYVSLESEIGPNVVDVIYWLITNYSTLEIDLASFLAVHATQINYPVAFALLEKHDLIQLIEDIAYQARCSVRIVNNKVFIRYLAQEPTSYKTLTESDIEQSSLKMTYTETEELYTKYIGQWKPHYALEKPWSIIVRNNMRRYNTNVVTKEFYIYNIKDLVYKSVTFWTIMKAKAYKIAMMKLFLNNLDLDLEDCVTLNFAQSFLTTGPIKAIVQKLSYNSESHSIDAELWLPVIAGTMEKYLFTWPQNLSVTEEFPEPLEIVAGNAGSPTGITVTNTDTPGNVNTLEYRPRDLGISKVSDNNDVYPDNPASELEELDYEEEENTDGFELPPEEPDERKKKEKEEWHNLSGGEKIEKAKAAVPYLGEGRVISKLTNKTIPLRVNGQDQPPVNITFSQYQVLLSSGKTIKAVVASKSSPLELPLDTVVDAYYDTLKQEHFIKIHRQDPGEIPP